MMIARARAGDVQKVTVDVVDLFESWPENLPSAIGGISAR
jgi:hypothetical protein